MADRIEPMWLDLAEAVAVHDRQLAKHGGGSGVRDRAMLELALARPVNQWFYGEDDPAKLAAAYAFGLARNHPFVDGNKCTAWVLARLLLALNGHTLRFDPADAINTVLALAAGNLSEQDLGDWFRAGLSED